MSWADVRHHYEERDDEPEDWIMDAPDAKVDAAADDLINNLAGNDQTPAEGFLIGYVTRLRKRIAEMEKDTEADAEEIEALVKDRDDKLRLALAGEVKVSTALVELNRLTSEHDESKTPTWWYQAVMDARDALYPKSPIK